jgi:hypothetical protein
VTLHDRLELAKHVGLYFRRYGMKVELELMRRHYARLLSEGRPPMRDEDFQRWCGLLQLPPFEKMFGVRPPHSRCVCGGPMWRVKERRLPDRVLVNCLDCRAEWLSLG